MLKSCHHVLLASCERGTLPVIQPKCSLKYGNHVYAVVTRRECIDKVGESLTFSLADPSEARRRRIMFCQFDLNPESPLSKDLKARHI